MKATSFIPRSSPRRYIRLFFQCQFAFLVVLAVIVLDWSFPPTRLGTYHEYLGLKKPMQVCVIGNSETEQNAHRVFDMWEGMFPTVFYVWGGERIQGVQRVNDQLAFVTNTENLSWAKGIKLALDTAREFYECEYYFTHDDDLVYYVNEWHQPKNKARVARLPLTLLDILKRYHPAIASFPWDVGDARYPGMIELAEKYQGKEVAPLTGFDNGMVLYHESIVDFFIPFSPRGEGGFFGEWTLVAHYIQLFGPLIFRENAIRINAMGYNNTINLDTFISKNGGSAEVTIDKGLAIVPESRHPYEFPNNEAYMGFLSSGLKITGARWGRLLTSKDVSLPAMNGPKRYTPEYVIGRLAKYYDLQHMALSTNEYLKGIGKEAYDEALSHADFSFRVNFFAYNRPDSFKRAWRAFVMADRIDRKVDAHVFIDYDPFMAEEARLEQLQTIRSLNNPHGQVFIRQAKEQQGLKTSIMNSWLALKNSEYAIFIEDDVEVSRHFLTYANAMVEAYFYRDGFDDKLFGISLYNARYNEATEDFYSIDNDHQPYILQQPQSWGGIYAPVAWREFLAYAEEWNGKDPLIPNSMTNRWPPEKSWKKTFIRYMRQTGGYFIYPNLPKSLSFSTNHVEVGTNDRPTDAKYRKIIDDKFAVPLLDTLEELNGVDPFVTPPRDELLIHDVFGRRLVRLWQLALGKDVNTFDQCTMVITVRNATDTFTSRLEYYQKLDLLAGIVVIWNNPDVEPPDTLPATSVPVSLLVMPNGSPNNKYSVQDLIGTDCVINMAEDWDMPFEHLEWEYQVWKGNFMNNVVGFSHQGRNHVKRTIPGQNANKAELLYANVAPCVGCHSTSRIGFFSMVLSPGMIYHRKYRGKYMHDIPSEAREFVDKVGECEDVLFNFMVAKATQSGPVIVDAWAEAPVIDDAKPVPNRSVQSRCLREFERIFGEMPLRYTTSLFTIPPKDKDGVNGYAIVAPGLKHMRSQGIIPIDWPCSRPLFKATGQCNLVTVGEGDWLKGKIGGWIDTDGERR